jgi:hypothetical protein
VTPWRYEARNFVDRQGALLSLTLRRPQDHTTFARLN